LCGQLEQNRKNSLVYITYLRLFDINWTWVSSTCKRMRRVILWTEIYQYDWVQNAIMIALMPTKSVLCALWYVFKLFFFRLSSFDYDVLILHSNETRSQSGATLFWKTTTRSNQLVVSDSWGISMYLVTYKQSTLSLTIVLFICIHM